MHACDHQSRGNLNRTRFFSVGQVKYNLCRHRCHALLNEMESYDLREFKCKLPRELWTHVTNFLLGSAKEELVNIFLKLKCPSILPVALGELMLKYKHIWYFESETGSGSHTKYHHFLTKFVLPYTKMYLESHPKKFSKVNLIGSIVNQKQHKAYSFFCHVFKAFNPVGQRHITSYINVKPNTRAIDLEGKFLSDWDAMLIADEIQHNTELESIYLEYNCIGDIGCEAIFRALRHNNTLFTLRMPYNQLSDASAIMISEFLEENSSLTSLSLHHNKFSSSSRSKVRKAWKNRSFGLNI